MPNQKPKLPPEMLHNARELRKNTTEAEKLLWAHLRNRQLANLKFRRQHPFEPFVLDFFCQEARLCIELDGSGHAEPEQMEYDRCRSSYLNERDIQVIRFWNHEVLNNLQGVLDTILGIASKRIEEMIHE